MNAHPKPLRVAEQLEPSGADIYHYRIVFKPSVIIPDVQIK